MDFQLARMFCYWSHLGPSQIAIVVSREVVTPRFQIHIGLLRRYPIQKTLHIFYKKTDPHELIIHLTL